jgi:hypothetical protein
MLKNSFIVLLSFLLLTSCFLACKKAPAVSQSAPSTDAQTITGKIEVVSIHPSPLSLPKDLRETYNKISIVQDDGQRVFIGCDSPVFEQLKASDGKSATLTAVLETDKYAYKMKDHKRYALKQLIEIK